VPASPEEKKLYDELRLLRGRSVSSSDAIPGFARPVLGMLGLLRSRKNNDEGAKMLIGISNQVVSPYKDLPHIRVCREKTRKGVRHYCLKQYRSTWGVLQLRNSFSPVA
jgi:hypothetical protein